MARDPTTHRTLATNRRARFEFEILAEIECGIELRGTEVKSLRAGGASIEQAYAMIQHGDLLLLNANIPEYKYGNIHNHAPARDRRLLAHKREIERFAARVREKGITIVPLELFFKGHLVKVRVGLAKGKKLHDKREGKKLDEAKRDMDRALSRRR